LGAGLGAAARAALAGAHLGDLDLGLGALDDVGEFDGEVVAEVCAALAAAAPLASATPAEDVSEEIAEEIGEIPQIAEILESAATGPTRTHARVAEAVVGLSLRGIRQDRVGLRGLLEALLGRGVVGIAIGMIRHRLRAIGLLELGVADISRDTQNFVVIAPCQWKGLEGLMGGRAGRGV
jgi:hypothetical protein